MQKVGVGSGLWLFISKVQMAKIITFIFTFKNECKLGNTSLN